MFRWLLALKRDVANLVEIENKLKNTLVFLRVEEYNSSLIAYNVTTNEFVCQGKDMEDLNAAFASRFPSKRWVQAEVTKT